MHPSTDVSSSSSTDANSSSRLDLGAFNSAFSRMLDLVRPVSLVLPEVDASTERANMLARVQTSVLNHVNAEVKLLVRRMVTFVENHYITQFEGLMRSLSAADIDALIMELRTVADSITADSVSNQANDVKQRFIEILKRWYAKNLHDVFDTAVPDSEPLVLPAAFVDRCIAQDVAHACSYEHPIILDKEFFCGISQGLLVNPVMIRVSDQIVNYDSLVQWIQSQTEQGLPALCPFTRKKINVANPIKASNECIRIKSAIVDKVVEYCLGYFLKSDGVQDKFNFPRIDATNEEIELGYKLERSQPPSDAFISVHSGSIMTQPIIITATHPGFTADTGEAITRNSLTVDVSDFYDVLSEAIIRAVQGDVFELKFGEHVIMRHELQDVDEKLDYIRTLAHEHIETRSDSALLGQIQFYVDELNDLHAQQQAAELETEPEVRTRANSIT